MRMLLIRHGRTDANRTHVLDTAAPGAALDDVGRRQAAALPAALAGEDIDVLYASTLTRARQTAAPLAAARGLEVRVRDGIREIEAGVLEGCCDAEGITRYRTVAVAWAAGRTEPRMPGAEDGAEFLARFDAVVAEAAASGAATAALVGHGSAIRVWAAARAHNVSVPFAAAHELPNTGMVVLEGTPEDGWHALSWTGGNLATPTPTLASTTPAQEPVPAPAPARVSRPSVSF
ncbi:histidine phosphatase family protein [Streptomyces sp. NPDC006307]|uniref:histidine phosphatase family protein n=1 Tax=Streptomyces sp. NPDC006307 TaxID=3156748 RepID=UPI0033A00B76